MQENAIHGEKMARLCYAECCFAFDILRGTRMCHTHLRPVPLYNICYKRQDLKKKKTVIDHKSCFRLLWPCIVNVGWRERNQQDATNLMFIIKLLSQHVSGIIMPIIRRTRVCTAAYGVLYWLWWLWLCGAGTRAVCTVKVHTSQQLHTTTAEHHMRQCTLLFSWWWA